MYFVRCLVQESFAGEEFDESQHDYPLMTPDQQERLIHNIACSMKGVPERIVKLQISHSSKADPEYGRRVAEAAGLAVTAGVA